MTLARRQHRDRRLQPARGAHRRGRDRSSSSSASRNPRASTRSSSSSRWRSCIIVILAGAAFVNPPTGSPSSRRTPATFGEYGWSGILRGAGVIFFAYIGFDAVSTAAQEAQNPQKDMPIGILGSLVVCTILYVLVSAVMVGLVPYTQLGVAGADGRGDRCGEGAGRRRVRSAGSSTIMPFIVKLGAIAGLSSVMVVMMLGQPRIFYAMANDGLLPPWAKKHAPEVPHAARHHASSPALPVAIAAGFTPIRHPRRAGQHRHAARVRDRVARHQSCCATSVPTCRARSARRPCRSSPILLAALVSLALMAGLPLETWDAADHLDGDRHRLYFALRLQAQQPARRRSRPDNEPAAAGWRTSSRRHRRWQHIIRRSGTGRSGGQPRGSGAARRGLPGPHGGGDAQGFGIVLVRQRSPPAELRARGKIKSARRGHSPRAATWDSQSSQRCPAPRSTSCSASVEAAQRQRPRTTASSSSRRCRRPRRRRRTTSSTRSRPRRTSTASAPSTSAASFRIALVARGVHARRHHGAARPHRLSTSRASRAVIIGRSDIVGKPMALMLLHADATVTICHSRTRDLPRVAAEADILVAALGRPAFVTHGLHQARCDRDRRRDEPVADRARWSACIAEDSPRRAVRQQGARCRSATSIPRSRRSPVRSRRCQAASDR